MYDWLGDTLQGSATVVTANRRLARVLQREFAVQQAEKGHKAWPSPTILAWSDWLSYLLQTASDQASLPTRLNHHQSRVLWERCFRREFSDDATAVANLVRLARDAWQRLADWQVPIGELAKSVQNEDQRLFASVAGRYLGTLEHEHWVDDAGLGSLACELIVSGRIPVASQYTFAGFDRTRPVLASIEAALQGRHCTVQTAPGRDTTGPLHLTSFVNREAEFRAAGAWALEHLLRDPESRVAIIASSLDQQAEHATRLVREGVVPGWQYADRSAAQAVNVSYGRALADYPAISIALLLLRWLVRDLRATEVGRVLRSPLVGTGGTAGRCRLELRLRQLPDRNWSPSMISSALHSDRGDTEAWRSLVASLSKRRREIPKSATPANWALYIDEVLKACHWPGDESLSSFDFQLTNRWRDLLNELARLDLVSRSMSLAVALQRLEQMAADTVFQPESEGAAVQLLGPLEASGAEFDALWITGLTAAHWPPQGRPSPLVSRRLQRRLGMPDANPADTLEYAETLIRKLSASAPEVICSYPLSEDDAEQTASDLLSGFDLSRSADYGDPGWHAARLAGGAQAVMVPDRVPAVEPDERIGGGAATIQRQLHDPIAAFVTGRLGVRSLHTQATGVPPSLRGNIVHDALYSLYQDKPTQADMALWRDSELERKLEQSIGFAFGRHERHCDDVLFELLQLERMRIRRLLKDFVRVDAARGDFEIASVEQQIDFSAAAVNLSLRVDRIDRMADGSLAILDYKTGSKKNFLRSDGQPGEIQLVAYASALDEPVAALALVYIDSREMTFSGAGRGYTEETEWPDLLRGWQQLVQRACDEMSLGDVRVNAVQGAQDARYLNLLSRYTESRRNA